MSWSWSDCADWKSYNKPNENVQMETTERLWSTEDDKNFSDWKIIIYLKDDAKMQKVTYFVHKTHLGCGPRRSEYFRRLYENLTSDVGFTREGNDATTTLEVENKSCIEVFPNFLDYIYSGEFCCNAAFQAVALRYLSDYFAIEQLYHDVSKFIENDLSMENGGQYIHEACSYHDEKLAKMVSKYLAHFTVLCQTPNNSMLNIPLETLLGPQGSPLLSQLADGFEEANKSSICVRIL